MDAYQLIAIPLILIGAFSIGLGIVCFSKSRRNVATLYTGMAITLTGLFALMAGLSYLLAGMGLSYELTYRLCWLGYVGIPGINGLAYSLRSKVARWHVWLNRFFIVFWIGVMVAILTTDAIDIAPKQILPYIETTARWELEIRAFSVIQLLYFLGQAIHTYRQTQGIQRSRAGYLLLGLCLYGTSGIVFAGILQILGIQVDPALTSYFSILFSIPLAYSMTRYRMLDLRTTMAHLTFALLCTLGFGLMHFLFFKIFAQSTSIDAAVLLSTLIFGILVFLSPIPNLLHQAITRYFRRGKESYSFTLEKLNRLIVSNAALEDLLRHYGSTLKHGIGSGFSSIYLIEGKTLSLKYTSEEVARGSLEEAWDPATPGGWSFLKSRDILVREEIFLQTSSGEGEADPVMPIFQKLGTPEVLVPLTLKDTPVGLLALGPKDDRSAYSREDLTFLDTAGIQVALAAENARLFSEAATDGLTGLFHQKYFKARLAGEIKRAQRHNHNLGVVILDIDFFKAINDRFGHLEGDNVLRKMSEVLRAHFRSEDVLARYGGEEFAMLLLETDPNKVVEIAERMRVLIEKTDFSPKFRVTASFGVYVFSPGLKLEDRNLEPLEALNRADQALYRAKHAGRNRVIEFKPDEFVSTTA